VVTLLKRVKDFLGWDSVKSAVCFTVHGRVWQYMRHAGEIDTDVGEYYCPHCKVNRFKREWL